MQTTWKPHTEHGDLTTRSNLPDSVYAFPKQKKEPLTDAPDAFPDAKPGDTPDAQPRDTPDAK